MRHAPPAKPRNKLAVFAPWINDIAMHLVNGSFFALLFEFPSLSRGKVGKAADLVFASFVRVQMEFVCSFFPAKSFATSPFFSSLFPIRKKG